VWGRVNAKSKIGLEHSSGQLLDKYLKLTPKIHDYDITAAKKQPDFSSHCVIGGAFVCACLKLMTDADNAVSSLPVTCEQKMYSKIILYLHTHVIKTVRVAECA
jgi:hypothetical protein